MAYSEKQRTDILNKICERLESGEALRTILKDKDFPSNTAFYEWIDGDKKKAEQYARACEARADSIFEDILDIADDQQDDVYINDDGDEFTNHNVIARSKLRVDARKWILGKLQPKKYGDKLDVTSDGEKIQTNIIQLGKGEEPKE